MWCCGAAEKNKMDTDIKIFFQEKSVEKSLVMREKSTHGGEIFFWTKEITTLKIPARTQLQMFHTSLKMLPTIVCISKYIML